MISARLYRENKIYGEPPQFGNRDHIEYVRKYENILSGQTAFKYFGVTPTEKKDKYVDRWIRFDCPLCQHRFEINDLEHDYCRVCKLNVRFEFKQLSCAVFVNPNSDL